MLTTKQIIDGLKNKEFIVRDAVFEYICNFHLYDDEDICGAFIYYINKNYTLINFHGLIYSKLNRQIIETLIQILLKEKDETIRQNIETVLAHHYRIIKDLSYSFEKLFTDKGKLLYCKKVDHFCSKTPDRLVELYLKSISQCIDTGIDDDTNAFLESAMGTALVQTIEGYNVLMVNIFGLLDQIEKETGDYDLFFEKYMPYFIYELCQYYEYEHACIVLEMYLTNMDFIGYAEECNFYFSAICNDKFVNEYIEKMKSIKNKYKEDYFYDISEYLNSELIDDFLWEELNKNYDSEIKENIIRILASRFNKDVIPYALNYIKNRNIDELEEIVLSLAPLLILEKYDDDISKSVIEKSKEIIGFLDNDNGIDDTSYIDDSMDEIHQGLRKMIGELHQLRLKDEPHIKEYLKIRKLHGRITNSMMNYYNSGKFNAIQRNISFDSDKTSILRTEFDTRTSVGTQAFGNVVIYKNSVNIGCITEEYIKNNKFRNQEKKDMLESMLHSKAGLFEIIMTDRNKGQVCFKDVLTDETYFVTDIGLSSNFNNDDFYFYSRLITYHNITFGTGLNLAFFKENDFIREWIKENKLQYNEKEEMNRFIELYTQYQKEDKKVSVQLNSY